MIKAVFLDIDGTLTSFETRSIPDSALAAIKQARQNGVKVFAATGRHTLMPQERGVVDGIEFDGYIAINGQICHLQDGAPIYTMPLNAADAKLVLKRCREHDFPCLMIGLHSLAITKLSDRVREFQQMVNIAVPPVVSPEDFAEPEMFSLMPYVDPSEESLVITGLAESTSARWCSLATDIIPARSGKEKGLEIFLKKFGISRAECMACGDGDNDISMLRYAGVGVAMASGRPEVIKAADFVAPAPIDNGLYYTFKKYNII